MLRGADLTTEAAKQLHELAELGAREWGHPGSESSSSATKSPNGITSYGNGGEDAQRGRKRKLDGALQENENESDAISIDAQSKSRLAAPVFLRRPSKPTAFPQSPFALPSNPNVPLNRSALSPLPVQAPNFPFSLKVGHQPMEVDLKGWLVSVDPATTNPLALRSQSQMTVIGGTIFGQDCVGVCGSDLSPPMISAALNKMSKYPRLVPIKCETDPVDLGTLFALRELVLQHKSMVEQMVETRMKEFMLFPAEDKIITLTHLLSAVHAASADVGDTATLIHAKESLLRVSTLVVGTAKTREIVAQHAAARERELEEPRAKRAKLAETTSPAPASPQHYVTMRQESPNWAWRKSSPQTQLVFPDIGRLNAKTTQLVQLPMREKLAGKLHESIYILLQNPVMRKLFYYEIPPGPLQQMVPLRLRVDLAVSSERKLAMEVVLPKTSDPTTWRARVIGAYVVSTDPVDTGARQNLNALSIVDRGCRIESDPTKLGDLADIGVSWSDVIGCEIPLQEKEFVPLIKMGARLPGMHKEAPIDVSGVLKLPLMRFLHVVKQDARISIKMTENDKKISDSDALGPHHPVGATKSYLVMISSGGKMPNIPMDDIGKVAASYASREVFIQRLSRAVKASHQPPSSKDDNDGLDDFEVRTPSLDDRKTSEAR